MVEAAPSGQETILLVEDESSLRVMIGEILAAAGYTILEGPTPEEALATAASHEGAIPLMVTDVILPRMSGRQLAEALRTSRPEARVLFMAGKPMMRSRTTGSSRPASISSRSPSRRRASCGRCARYWTAQRHRSRVLEGDRYRMTGKRSYPSLSR